MDDWKGPEDWALVVVWFFFFTTVLCVLIAWAHKGRHGRD
jgi:hypothetical protein